jgi:hypothetical protein
MKDHVLRYLSGAPVIGSQAVVAQTALNLIQKSGYDNLLLEDSALHGGEPFFSIFVNHMQDEVETGLPQQAQIYCDLDDNTIEVFIMVRTYDEDSEDSVEDCMEEVVTVDFSWDQLESLIKEYAPVIIA